MITILCVGKVRESSLISLINEYLKRISKYNKINIVEINDEKFDKNLSENEKLQIKNIECNKIIEKINNITNPYVISLDLKGETLTSENLAKKISEISTYNSSNIVFVIGGSLGLNENILKISNLMLSFSTLTFPHQLIRLFLVEQIFRSYKILNNETYHH